MAASGAAALGYEVTWTQQAAVWLGHESAAAFAVVSAFFGGLALGSALFGARIDRSSHPALWYGVCEAVIGLWGLALAVLMEPSTRALLAVIGA